MPVSQEVLNTTVAQKIDKGINSFETATPFLDKLQSKVQVSTMDSGTYIERPFLGGSPGTVTALDVGDEVFSTTRTPQSRVLRVETARFAGAVSIPGKELSENDGKLGALNLYRRYPEAYLQSLAQDMESWWLIAAVPSVGNTMTNSQAARLVTLNGAYNSGVGTGVTNGVLDFATPALQSDTVFDLAKSQTYSHYNQFASSSGWSTDGMLKLRDLYRKCTVYGPGGPDLIYPDVDTYANFDLDRLAQVRTKMVEDKTEKSSTLLLNLGSRAELVYAHYLDRTASSFAGTDAADGVVYLINTDFWEMVWRQKPALGKFEDRTADQDVLIAKFLMHGNSICNKLAAQGALVGTAV